MSEVLKERREHEVLVGVSAQVLQGYSGVRFEPDWEWTGLQTSDRRIGTRFLNLELCSVVGYVGSFQSDKWRMSPEQKLTFLFSKFISKIYP